MHILGIFFEGPNSGACLFSDGKLIAMAEEERFVRMKRAANMFPARTIRYCLQEGGIELPEVSIVAVGWDHRKYPGMIDKHMASISCRDQDPFADIAESIIHTSMDLDWTIFNIRNGLRQIDLRAEPEIRFYSHHECHAASVHYLSGFDKSCILSLDGSGEEIATSTWLGDGDELKQLDVWNLPNSIGWFYAAVTEFLGFKAYSGEGKVMGLAAYGRSDPALAEKLRKMIYTTSDGYELDPTYIYYGKRNWSRRYTDKLVAMLGKPRLADEPLTAYHENLAFEAQQLLEEIGVDLTRRLIGQTGVRKLCISGGVAMNCKMNGVLSHLPEVEEVFINPASNDSGTALGAALIAIREEGMSPRLNKLDHPYWGPGFTDGTIEDALKACKLSYEKVDDPSVSAAEMLDRGNIVGWFQDRMEFGARALGHRSILANPTISDMKDQINRQVKFREPFRPFAPSMTVEAMNDYMIDPHDSPFMILAYWVKDGYDKALPSIVHVDGTVRPQTVRRTVNEPYWRLIHEFGERSGHPVILNTSFNIRGEPIVCTPNEAIRCFYATGMDAMCIGSFVLRK